MSAPVAVMVWPIRAVAALTVDGDVIAARDPLPRLVHEAMTLVPEVAAVAGWRVAGAPCRWAIVPGSVMNMSHEDEVLRCEVPIEFLNPSGRPTEAVNRDVSRDVSRDVNRNVDVDVDVDERVDVDGETRPPVGRRTSTPPVLGPAGADKRVVWGASSW